MRKLERKASYCQARIVTFHSGSIYLVPVNRIKFTTGFHFFCEQSLWQVSLLQPDLTVEVVAKKGTHPCPMVHVTISRLSRELYESYCSQQLPDKIYQFR